MTYTIPSLTFSCDSGSTLSYAGAGAAAGVGAAAGAGAAAMTGAATAAAGPSMSRRTFKWKVPICEWADADLAGKF